MTTITRQIPRQSVIYTLLIERVEVIESFSSAESADVGKLVFDAKQLVVFRYAVRTGRCAGFDLPGIRRNSDIRDGGVFASPERWEITAV